MHDVTRALFWGGSRSTKPCVFPCKVAAAGDERYLVCAAVAAAVGLSFFLPQCNGGFKLLWVCLCVRIYRVFWNLWLQIPLEWLHDVAWAMFWGGSWSTKPCVFPCKVAAAGDERYLVCAAVAAAVGLSFFLSQCNGGFKLLWVCLCVRIYRLFWNLWLQIPLEWLHDIAWAMFWGGSRNTKPCVFPCKVAAAGDERYLVCAAVAAAVGLSFFLPQCNGGLKLLWVWLCVRIYRVFWNLWLQIPLEWLHDVAWAMFWGGSWSTKPCVFPCKVAAAGDERYLVCAAVAAAVGLSFFLPQCNGGLKLLWVWLCVRIYRVFWNLWLQIPLEWLHDVTWAMFWGGSRSTKPCVFPCKVAAGDDERYLVCATVAAAVGLSFFFAAA